MKKIIVILVLVLFSCGQGDIEEENQNINHSNECNIAGITQTTPLDLNISSQDRKNVAKFRPHFISESPDPDDWRPNQFITKCMAYPNPISFRSPGGVIIAYVLRCQADNAELRIVDSQCNQVFKAHIDGFADYNEFLWKLRDNLDKPVSVGIYRCFVTVSKGVSKRSPPNKKDEGINFQVSGCDSGVYTTYGDIRIRP